MPEPRWRGTGSTVFISHTRLGPDDVARLEQVRHLTLWSCAAPDGFLDRLPGLDLLDLRGTSVPLIQGLASSHLRGLALSHDRGLTRLDLSHCAKLEFLEIYALSQLTAVPDLTAMARLRRVNLGQLIRLRDWQPLLFAPAMAELELINKMVPDLEVLGQLAIRDSFTGFQWDPPDVGQTTVRAAWHAADRPACGYVRISDLARPDSR